MLETNEIKKIIFTEKEKTFIYPSNAVSYTLEIINSGCKEIHFKRIQLGEASLPDEAFTDFYPVEIHQSGMVAVLLIADSKRAREINNYVLPDHLGFNLIIGYLSWQKSTLQIKELTKLLNHYASEKVVLLSTSKNTDTFLQKIGSNLNSSTEVVLAKQLVENESSSMENHWLKESINFTNIQDAINKVIEYFKE